MILYRLWQLEESLTQGQGDQKRITALRNIKELLSKIDFSAELIPEKNLRKFRELLVNLKGNNLSKVESDLVDSLVVEE